MEIYFDVDGTILAPSQYEYPENKKAADEFRNRIAGLIKDFKCAEHGEEPKIIFYMTEESIESIKQVEVSGCCDTFKNAVFEKITIEDDE